MDLASDSVEIERNETGKCSSSSVIAMDITREDQSERDFCINILRSYGLLGGGFPTEYGAFEGDAVITGDSCCRRSCKICGQFADSLKMLICDQCEEAYHPSCWNPHWKKKLPLDEWLCHSCLKKKRKILSETITRSSPSINSETGGTILLMLKESEPYTTKVQMGKDFQAEVPDWSGPIGRHMENPSRNLDIQNGSGNQSTRKKGRRGTLLKELTYSLSGEQRIPIEFDSSGKPLGQNRKKFKSFVALLGRSKASILKNEWDDVELHVKDQIWQNIKLSYNIPDNEMLRKKLIQYAGERWKAFKTSLTSRYVFGEFRGVNPCEEYPFLDEETWQAFLQSREDSTFLEKRRKAQEIQAKNLCPHRLSRGGYELLEEKIMNEKWKQRQEAQQSNPSIVLSPPSLPTRHEKWKRARQTKSGEYISEEARSIAGKIDSLEEKCSQGNFTPVGRDDILATAIGKPEHPGRVRGIGRGVGIKQYFGALTCHYPGVVTRDEMKVILAQVKEQMAAEITAAIKEQTAAQIAAMREEMIPMSSCQMNTTTQPAHSPVVQSQKGSCVHRHLTENPTFQHTGANCELYLEDPHLRLVAYGRVCNLGPTIHHRQIEEDQVRVMVERVKDANALVPFPSEEVQTVGQAHNNFILWPQKLVQVVPAKEIALSSEAVPKLQSQLQMDPLTRLCVAAMKIKEPLQLNMDPDVIGKECNFFIYRKDILEFLMGNEMLCVSVIQVFLMYLHHLCISKGKSDKYGFISPFYIQVVGNNADMTSSYINSRLCEGNKECYLAPYHHGQHWQLMIICPKQNVVTFLCSLWYKPRKELKNMIDTALSMYHELVGKHSQNLKKPTWVLPQCRKQVVDTECGYFVMRHMLNIISTNILESFEQRFNVKDPFSEEEIDDIRNLWANYFLSITSL